MSMSIKLSTSQIKSLENGATMLIFPCEHEIISSDKERTVFKVEEWEHDQPTDLYIKDFAPLQKGDKYVWIKESVFIADNGGLYHGIQHGIGDYCIPIVSGTLVPASQMTKEQSRYSIDCLEVKLVRVQDIKTKQWANIIPNDGIFLDYNIKTCLKHTGITYQDNDYVFLAEVKLNKKDTNV